MKTIKWFCLSILLLTCTLNASERIYIDNDELDLEQDNFHIHLGQNIWLETNTVHRDDSGCFTYSSDVMSDSAGVYKNKWKCPYCYQYWPMGTACQNPDCPSKYKR